MERGSGILLHISSLPNKYGIGSFGKSAYQFIRFLYASKQKYWQILPLNPTTYKDSPYQSNCSFALNPYFIDLDLLIKKGYLNKEDVKSAYVRNPKFVDYGKLYNTRYDILKKAYKNGYIIEEEKIKKFYKHQKFWLKDYALFMSIKDLNNGEAYLNWDKDLMMHKKASLNKIYNEHKDLFNFYVFIQYIAYSQYFKLKKYAKKKGIKIIGDMPIYVSSDSSDVWANAKYFKLNKLRKPKKVAGVPPDYFSQDGQLWGNPIYNYDRMKKDHYKWFYKRFKLAFKLYDYVRIDHFRGFASYYEIDSKDNNARNGKWIKGPGKDLFNTLKTKFKTFNVIAEDLGIIDDEVKELLKETSFPSLKVYQFAFSDYQKCLNKELDDEIEISTLSKEDIKLLKLTNPYLPHNYDENCVAYIGTHDNDVLLNYLIEHKEEWISMMDYLQIDRPQYIYDTLLGSLFRSKANVTIFTMQDLLKLNKDARMNTPGKENHNWGFILKRKYLTKELSNYLSIMVKETSR